MHAWHEADVQHHPVHAQTNAVHLHIACPMYARMRVRACMSLRMPPTPPCMYLNCVSAAASALAAQGSTPQPQFADWRSLVEVKPLFQLSAVPILTGDELIGVLTLGVETEEAADAIAWQLYMRLVTTTINMLIKDNVLKYMQVGEGCGSRSGGCRRSVGGGWEEWARRRRVHRMEMAGLGWVGVHPFLQLQGQQGWIMIPPGRTDTLSNASCTSMM
eukprot:363985-Chlamydomonas_euryale.AAC.3